MAKAKKTVTAAPAPVEDKRKTVLLTMDKINKEFGLGAIRELGDASELGVGVIPSGSLGLDLALGVGGYPKGRIVEIYGPESSGKTTIALHAIAEAQKLGGEVAFIDAEHALDPIYAKALGVNTDTLLISQPDSGEQALSITEALVLSGAIDVIVIDSVAALVPQQEIEGEMGSASVGLQARLMSQALRKLSGSVSKTNCIVIFINQLREKINVSYGNPETTTGGRALKFYASVRLDIRKTETLKNGSDIYGSRTKVKVVKNKVASPFKTAEFDILYGKGISKAGEIIDLGVEAGIVRKSGSWFSYGDERLAQGRDAVRRLLEENHALADEIEAKVKEYFIAATDKEKVEDGELDEDVLDIRLLDEDEI